MRQPYDSSSFTAKFAIFLGTSALGRQLTEFRITACLSAKLTNSHAKPMAPHGGPRLAEQTEFDSIVLGGAI
jgi:hypothetical protein